MRWVSRIVRASASVAIGRDRDRIEDDAGFELFHLAHVGGLFFGRHVAVDDAHAAGLRHGDGEPPSVTVSIAAESSGTPSSIDFGDFGARVGLSRQHVGGARHKQDVVKCQSFAELQADPFL